MHTHSHPLTQSHLFEGKCKLGVMENPTFYVTIGNISTRNRIHTNLKGLYLENTLLILSHTLATVLVTL